MPKHRYQRREPTHDWLSEQFALLYNVHRSLSQQWIQGQQLLPLLDGLDEMEPAAYAECIAAINTYHREHLQPLVVCSRTNEYEAAARRERLSLHTAIIVQPLSKEQIDAHLAEAGRPFEALRRALIKNTALRELASSPLMLSVLMLTYQGTSVRLASLKGAELLLQVWTNYVQRMVKQKGNAKRYPGERTCVWLHWLAREMRECNQTIFSLKQLQPDWLPTRRRAVYRWSAGLVFGLLFGLLGVVLAGLFYEMDVALVYGLVIGLGVGLDTKIELADALTWSWMELRSRLGVVLRIGLCIGLVGVGVDGLNFGVRVGLTDGLVAGLVAGYSGKQLTGRLILSPNEEIRRSVKNGLFMMVGGLVFRAEGLLGISLVVGLVIGLVAGLGVGLYDGLGTAIKHYILRFWLWRTHAFPWRAVSFLDDATARILLRHVGEGYSFTHDLLREHFADLNTQASPTSTAGSSI